MRSTGKHFHVDSIVYEPSFVANSAKAVGFVIDLDLYSESSHRITRYDARVEKCWHFSFCD